MQMENKKFTIVILFKKWKQNYVSFNLLLMGSKPTDSKLI